MRKTVKIFLIVVLSICVLVGAAFIGVNTYLDSLIENVVVEEIDDNDINITIIEPTQTRHEVVNFMLVGADNSELDRENSYVQARSDVFKIISLDYTDKKIKITSLDRDVVVWMPIENEFGHFNWAYAYGGAKSSLAAINYNLDLDVSKYVGISFAGFRDIINYIGGVDINLTSAEAYTINTSVNIDKQYVTEGLNHLDGATALIYSRIRHIDSDFERMDRQNVVIKAVVDKIKEKDITECYNIISQCLKYVTTNLDSEEIKEYLVDVLQFDLSNIDTHMYPSGRYDDVSGSKIGGYVLRSYSDAVTQIHNFIYDDENYVPTQTIYDIEEKIYSTLGEFKK